MLKGIIFCRIFRDFGHIPGIDLAYVRNGYVYHTIYDNVAMIHPGSIQRAGLLLIFRFWFNMCFYSKYLNWY